MWETLSGKKSDHYSVMRLCNQNSGLEALKEMFPDGKDEENKERQ